MMDEISNSVDTLREEVAANTAVVRGHIERTDQRFESLTDAVTRIAHANEANYSEFVSHKTWEEGYHKADTERHNQLAGQVSTMAQTVNDGFARLEKTINDKDVQLRQDLSGYFNIETTAKTGGQVAAWLAKWGAVGIALAWTWNNWVIPLLKKFGVF